MQPANCMISVSGHLQLIDFGLSKVVSPPSGTPRPSGRSADGGATGEGSASERALDVARKVLPLRDTPETDPDDADAAAAAEMGDDAHDTHDTHAVRAVHVLLVDPDKVSTCARRLRELYVTLTVVRSVEEAAMRLGLLQAPVT